MKKVIFGPNGPKDAETGEIIDLNNSELQKYVRKPAKTGPPPEKQTESKETQEPAKPVKPPKQPSVSVPPGPKPVSYTKYEVTPESTFTVRFCLSFDDGRAHVYTGDQKIGHPEFELHWVTFRMWTYREQLEWRQRCTQYDNMTGMTRFNSDQFNEIKVRNLIKAWSFEEYDVKFKLLHVHGYLSDESWNLINGMYPVIVDNILFMMNRVLEENG